MVNFQQLARQSLLLSMFLLLLAGCHLTPKTAESNASEQPYKSYGEYYLTLQQLTHQQLIEEVTKQQLSIEQQAKANIERDYDPQIKLLLLYSLPQSPIYSSFNAKALLNQMKNEGDNAAFAHINPSEQAFITLLRDQLNQRLLMRNRLLAQQQEQQAFALKQQKLLIERIQLLEQTIKQLKNIEQTIDKRDQ